MAAAAGPVAAVAGPVAAAAVLWRRRQFCGSGSRPPSGRPTARATIDRTPLGRSQGDKRWAVPDPVVALCHRHTTLEQLRGDDRYTPNSTRDAREEREVLQASRWERYFKSRPGLARSAAIGFVFCPVIFSLSVLFGFLKLVAHAPPGDRGAVSYCGDTSERAVAASVPTISLYGVKG